MKHQHIIAWASTAVWALEYGKWAQLQGFLNVIAAGGTVDPAIVAEIVAAGRRGDVQRSVDSLAVIPIAGTIVPRGNMLAQSSGATSPDTIRAELRAAMAESSVKGILLDINSPGGAVDGIEELADEIHRARREKPVHAIANGLSASAAYWLGTQAERLSVTPSGEVGSIGVFAEHADMSKALEMEGVKPTLVSAGKWKVDGNPYEPLTDSARAHLQERVNDYYGQFTKAVARGRGVTVDAVRGGFGEGRVVGSRQAVREGMADAVETFDEALSALARRVRQGSAPGQAAALAGYGSARAYWYNEGDTGTESTVATVMLASVQNRTADVTEDEAQAAATAPMEQPEPVAAGLSVDSRRRRLRLAGA